jgi:hypothetical protein
VCPIIVCITPGVQAAALSCLQHKQVCALKDKQCLPDFLSKQPGGLEVCFCHKERPLVQVVEQHN